MCGIVGFISNEKLKNWTNRRDFFKQALITDVIRGYHSTGVFGMFAKNKHKGAAVSYKKAVDPITFWDIREAGQYLYNVDDFQCLFGHNRQATKGDVNHVNAHPFSHGPITGVHNGTLRSANGLKNFYDFDVDSEALIYNIAELGPEETFAKADGAFAVVWVDERDRTIHLIRNDERPLAIGRNEAGSMFVASEKDMLKWIANRNYISFEEILVLKPGIEMIVDADNVKDIKLVERKLYTPRKSTNVQAGPWPHHNRPPLPDYSKKDKHKAAKNKRQEKMNELLASLDLKIGDVVDFFVWNSQKYRMNENASGFLEGTMDEAPYADVLVHGVKNVESYFDLVEQAATATSVVIGATEDEKGDVTVICDPEELEVALYSGENKKEEKKEECNVFTEGDEKEKAFFRGPQGVYLSKDEWQRLAEDGCCNCSTNVFTYQHKEVAWTSDCQPICPSCAYELTMEHSNVIDTPPATGNAVN